MPIELEGIYVVDRAYVDFDWLYSINQQNAFFVSRLKKSIKWTKIISHPVDKAPGLRSDQEILLFAKNTSWGVVYFYPIDIITKLSGQQ